MGFFLTARNSTFQLHASASCWRSPHMSTVWIASRWFRLHDNELLAGTCWRCAPPPGVVYKATAPLWGHKKTWKPHKTACQSQWGLWFSFWGMCNVPVHTAAALCNGLTAVFRAFFSLSENLCPVEASQENKASCGSTIDSVRWGLNSWYAPRQFLVLIIECIRFVAPGKFKWMVRSLLRMFKSLALYLAHYF